MRGAILSPQGWQKFQTAKQQAESDETWGKRFTQEELSDRTGLSLNTLAMMKAIASLELECDRLSSLVKYC